MLDQLDGQVANLPTGLTKHDMEPAYEFMAKWHRGCKFTIAQSFLLSCRSGCRKTTHGTVVPPSRWPSAFLVESCSKMPFGKRTGRALLISRQVWSTRRG